jgi:hypothetical protein
MASGCSGSVRFALCKVALSQSEFLLPACRGWGFSCMCKSPRLVARGDRGGEGREGGCILSTEEDHGHNILGKSSPARVVLIFINPFLV